MAKSTNFTLITSEIRVLMSAFDNPKDIRVQGAKITLMKKEYKPVRVDKLSIYGNNEESFGIVASRTNHFIIVGTYDPTMYASVAVEAVEKLAEYFRSKGQ